VRCARGHRMRRVAMPQPSHDAAYFSGVYPMRLGLLSVGRNMMSNAHPILFLGYRDFATLGTRRRAAAGGALSRARRHTRSPFTHRQPRRL
jgi:hypothetical protein